MMEQFEKLKRDIEEALALVADRNAIEQLRVEFFGRKGKMAELMKQMASLTEEQRKVVGKAANEAKTAAEAVFTEKQKALELKEAGAIFEREWIDITEPGVWPKEGHLHPVSTAIAEITDLFSQIGFTRIRAPEIDWDYYAFESLNMPQDHPARDDWETFFVAQTKAQAGTGAKGRIVLTPHTSNSQVREMEKKKLPIRMININRTYRRQSDITHSPMFHQFEGLMIDKGITIAHLKGVLDYFARQYFGPERKIRLRPHHFRFTEPSFEVDVSCGACGGTGAGCRVCKSGWLELGGAGMGHPNVIKAGGLDPEIYTGFAFGWGVERTLMMREGMPVDDIRLLYRNDLRFVEQF